METTPTITTAAPTSCPPAPSCPACPANHWQRATVIGIVLGPLLGALVGGLVVAWVNHHLAARQRRRDEEASREGPGAVPLRPLPRPRPASIGAARHRRFRLRRRRQQPQQQQQQREEAGPVAASVVQQGGSPEVRAPIPPYLRRGRAPRPGPHDRRGLRDSAAGHEAVFRQGKARVRGEALGLAVQPRRPGAPAEEVGIEKADPAYELKRDGWFNVRPVDFYAKVRPKTLWSGVGVQGRGGLRHKIPW
ncbi:hypothetical protein DL768_000080 [Monosporascus sp. mg162]|nr:hypothetical protein DL768_000080 [Monosporascus sp. mg162]